MDDESIDNIKVQFGKFKPLILKILSNSLKMVIFSVKFVCFVS